MASTRRFLVTWVSGSSYALPLLWIVAALTWLVPLLSPSAAGHHLYLVPLIAWPGLVLLALGSLAVLVLARRRGLAILATWRLRTLGLLQGLLVAIIAIGSVPVLTFDLHPERSIEATAIHPPFALVAALAIATEVVLLHRRTRAQQGPTGP